MPVARAASPWVSNRFIVLPVAMSNCSTGLPTLLPFAVDEEEDADPRPPWEEDIISLAFRFFPACWRGLAAADDDDDDDV